METMAAIARSPRISRAITTVERRVVNPTVARVLRSRFHPLLSRWFAMLAYEGRVSGNAIATPVLYEWDGPNIVVLTVRDEATWWKNFREEHPATLRVRGTECNTSGRAVTDNSVIADWLCELDRRSRLWKLVLREYGFTSEWTASERKRVAEDLVVVRFAPLTQQRSTDCTGPAHRK